MRPEQLFQAFADILTDVVKRPFRDTPLTFDEWIAINQRWETMYAMNRHAAMGNHEKALLAKEQKGEPKCK